MKSVSGKLLLTCMYKQIKNKFEIFVTSLKAAHLS